MTDTITTLSTFAKVFGAEDCAGDLATKLSCSEVEALADMLTVAGAPEAAALWIDCHAEGDDPGDDHYTGTEDEEAGR